MVEAPDRPAEQGVRQECADRISRACADRHVVDKLELLSDAVVETQDRRIFVANIKTNDELIPLKIIADKTAEGRTIGELRGRQLHIAVTALNTGLPAIPTGKAGANVPRKAGGSPGQSAECAPSMPANKAIAASAKAPHTD